MDFERENDMMEQRQEIMDDAVDEAMGVDDEAESEDVINEVLDEIGVDLGQSVQSLVHDHNLDTLTLSRCQKRPLAYKALLYRKGGSHKPLAASRAVTKTCRPG